MKKRRERGRGGARVSSLTKREALLVRELAITPGCPVAWPLLADAMGVESRYQVHWAVQSIRRKFGRDAIRNVYGRGYMVEKSAL